MANITIEDKKREIIDKAHVLGRKSNIEILTIVQTAYEDDLQDYVDKRMLDAALSDEGVKRGVDRGVSVLNEIEVYEEARAKCLSPFMSDEPDATPSILLDDLSDELITRIHNFLIAKIEELNKPVVN